MKIRRLPLNFGGAARFAAVREPDGSDELSVASADTETAVALIDRLLVERGPGCLAPGGAAKLTASDRDQILAAVTVACFGDRVESTLRCVDCASPFDFEFSLTGLAAHIAASASLASAPERLPTGADEIAVAELAPAAAAEALARRSLGEAAGAEEIAAFAERLAACAPVISLDLDAVCPECGRVNQTSFDLQAYLLGGLLANRAALIREIHKLASAYGWALDDILRLDRALRRALVAQVDGVAARGGSTRLRA